MTATYAFDPLSRRKTKTVNSVTTDYLSEGDREIAEYNGSGTFQRRMVYGPGLDEPVVIIDASSVKNYVHTDGLGSIVALTNASGTVIDKYTYSPFGESASLAGAASRFTGRRIDPETGLYHYRARAYSPTIGRFLQPDPKGYDGGINLYSYVRNDPLNLIDPMGTDFFGDVGDAFSNFFSDPAGYFMSTLPSAMGTAWGACNICNDPGAQVSMPPLGALGAFATALRAGSSLGAEAEATADIFRAVRPEELADIQAINSFRNLMGGVEGKYFTSSAEEASTYARMAVRSFGDQPYSIVRTQIPMSQYNNFLSPSVDGGITSLLIPGDQLPGLVPHVLNSMPLPRL